MSDAASPRSDHSGKPRRRVLLLCNGTAQQTTGRLFSEMALRLSRHHAVNLQLRSFPQGIRHKIIPLLTTELQNCRRIFSSDVIIVHSALSLSLLSMICAKLLRRKIVAFIWDFYPQSTRIAGRIRNRILLWAYGVTEAWAYRLADVIYVPTADYASYEALHGNRNVCQLPLWPCDPLQSPSGGMSAPDVVHLTFAGQINAIRGLEKSMEALLSRNSGKIVLHLFSKNSAPEALARLAAADGNLEICHHGFVDALILQNMLGRMDFGLIAIDQSFQLPAFPSKALAYLAAGLPIVYDGPRMKGLESVLDDYKIGMTLRQFSQMNNAQLKAWRAGFIDRRDRYMDRIDKKWKNFAEIL